MRVWPLGRISTVVLLAATLAACGQGQRARGDSQEAIEVLASAVHLRVSISDDKLAQANQMDRENAATTIVSATEQALTAHPQFATVQVISVAIVHAAPKDGHESAHTEDVLEFRKGPDDRFSHHVT